ncbi:hypothetical protein EXU57_22880 [Segetibacter sp. 3557_3]|uniref:hypothetical protein n=1 Tax=Segetibacter sp. 3557_3 TaxID=2547429 RepID=UPI001058BF51|nr:hypothetical protein [Segetibacter sp. 3557_3]TDH19747.1 hypothetical protein EXU57_22880 [Segetibacter sp. 3557_3]
MQSFQPYIVSEDSASRLHLVEPTWRQRVYFIIFRVVPLFFLLQLILLAVASRDEPEIPPAVIIGVISITIIPVALLLSRSYVAEVDISPTSIGITRKYCFGKRTFEHLITDIKEIRCRKRVGKGGGLFYQLALKNNSTPTKMLSIPTLFMSDAKRSNINETLQKITGLRVVNS